MKIKLFDYITLAFSIAIFFTFFLYGRSLSGEEGYLMIESNDGQYLYSLNTDQSITVKGLQGECVIVIKNGKAHFDHSDCQDQLCVQMGEIEHGGEWAACLPNEVFIAIEGREEEEIDATVF